MTTPKLPTALNTPATRLLHGMGVPVQAQRYAWRAHGGAAHAARELGWPLHAVIKTLVLQDQDGAPLIALMHGDLALSTKALARQAGCKSVQPCVPHMAERHSGCRVGGISPFATRRPMPVYMEHSILRLEQILINGGQRGLLLQMAPQVCVQLLAARPVHCALQPREAR